MTGTETRRKAGMNPELVSGRLVPPDDRERCCFKCCVTGRGMPLIISLDRKRLMLHTSAIPGLQRQEDCEFKVCCGIY